MICGGGVLSTILSVSGLAAGMVYIHSLQHRQQAGVMKLKSQLCFLV